MRKEFNFRAGGAAGDGIASMGEILTKICSRNGLNVHSYNTYHRWKVTISFTSRKDLKESKMMW